MPLQSTPSYPLTFGKHFLRHCTISIRTTFSIHTKAKAVMGKYKHDRVKNYLKIFHRLDIKKMNFVQNSSPRSQSYHVLSAQLKLPPTFQIRSSWTLIEINGSKFFFVSVLRAFSFIGPKIYHNQPGSGEN